MFSATGLLVLACACAVTVNAQVDDKCISVQIGHVSGHTAVYAQGQFYAQDTDELLATHPDCVKGEVGVLAWVCDNDVKPSAYFIDFNNLIVHRNGACIGYATVDATAYCA